MNVELTFSTPHPPTIVNALIHSLIENSPFFPVSPHELGTQQWRLSLTARQSEMVVGFASVAEFQIRLCRHVDINSVIRTDKSQLSIAS